MLIAVDPGNTTGWAMLDAPSNPEFQSGMVEGRHAFYEWFYQQLSGFYALPAIKVSREPLILVVEKFTITEATARKSPQPDPLYIIGHLDAIAHRDDIGWVYQLPSQAMSFATNDKLKAVGWYRPGKGHDNDAARHLMLYAVRHPEHVHHSKGKEILQTVAASLGISVYPDQKFDKPDAPVYYNGSGYYCEVC